MSDLDTLATQEPTGIESPVAMDTTISEAWKDISKDLQAPQDTVARDVAGKFAKKEPAEEVVPKEPTIPTPEVPQVPEQTFEKPEIPATPATDAVKAPSSWKKEAQEAFGTLPPHVQNEVIRRESDFHKGIEQFKGQAQTAQRYEQAMAPYMQTIQKLGVTPEVAISALMKADHTLRYAPQAVKTQEFLKLAQNYGIDLSQQHDPQVADLQRKLYELEQQQTTLQSSNEQREIETLTSEINSFSQGKEHFDAVSVEMVALLPLMRQQNPTLSNQDLLQMAYDRATYANPQTRAAILAKQQEERSAEAKRIANAARTAASVNVSSRGNVAPAGPARTPWNDADIKADAVRLGLA